MERVGCALYLPNHWVALMCKYRTAELKAQKKILVSCNADWVSFNVLSSLR